MKKNHKHEDIFLKKDTQEWWKIKYFVDAQRSSMSYTGYRVQTFKPNFFLWLLWRLINKKDDSTTTIALWPRIKCLLLLKWVSLQFTIVLFKGPELWLVRCHFQPLSFLVPKSCLKCLTSFVSAAKSAGGKVATKAGAYGGSEVGSIIGELLFSEALMNNFRIV